MKLRKVLLIFALSIFCFACMSPSNVTIKKEFLAKHPNAEIVSTELIFEQDYVETYLIKYKEKFSDEIQMDDFSLRRNYGIWQSCDDRIEIKCK